MLTGLLVFNGVFAAAILVRRLQAKAGSWASVASASNWDCRLWLNKRVGSSALLFSLLKKKKVRSCGPFKTWCPEEDSNLHSVATART